MSKQVFLAVGMGMAATVLSSCNSGNAPDSGSEIPAGKNTATLFVKMDELPERFSFPFGVYEVEVHADGTKLGIINPGQSRSFTFVPRRGGGVIELKDYTTGVKDLATRKYGNFIEPGRVFVIDASGVNDLATRKYRIEAGDVLVIDAYCVVAEWKKRSPGVLQISNLPLVRIRGESIPENLEIGKLTLEETPERVYAGEQIVSTPLTQEIERVRTIDQTIEVSEAVTLAGETGINAAFVAKITVQVEHRQGRQLKKSETYRRKVTVLGNGRKYKLVWYDLVRHGTVEVKYTIAGQPTPVTKTVPFQYKEEPILEIEEVK